MNAHAPVPSIVSLVDGQVVTTTLAIAEGTDNDHASVIKLVRTYQNDLEEFGRVGFEIAPFETAGGTQQREVATLNEQQSTLILTYMRNSDIVRAFKKRLVKAFYELAQRPALDPMQVLSDPAVMRGLLLSYTEKVLALESQVGEMAPKAAALDRLSASDGSLCITDAAKALNVQPKQLFDTLKTRRWIYKRAGGKHWLGYQDKVQAGYIEHKITTVSRSDGSEKSVEQALLTSKGIAKLAALVNGGVQ